LTITILLNKAYLVSDIKEEVSKSSIYQYDYHYKPMRLSISENTINSHLFINHNKLQKLERMYTILVNNYNITAAHNSQPHYFHKLQLCNDPIKNTAHITRMYMKQENYNTVTNSVSFNYKKSIAPK
jgi:hypothetical protein